MKKIVLFTTLAVFLFGHAFAESVYYQEDIISSNKTRSQQKFENMQLKTNHALYMHDDFSKRYQNIKPTVHLQDNDQDKKIDKKN